MKYAEVAVNSPVAQRRLFSYSIPPDMPITVGHAVWVPFGPNLVQGILFQVSDQPAVEETREIAEAIGLQPMLSPPRVELAKWIGDHYLSSFFEAASLMLPPGFERRLLTFIQPTANPSPVALASLTSSQKEVFRYLQRRGRAELRQLKKTLGGKRADVIIGQLLRKGLIIRTRELERVKVGPKVVPYLRLAIDADRVQEAIPLLERRRAFKQAALLKLLVTQSVSRSEAKRIIGCSSGPIQGLRRKGLVSVKEIQVQRDPLQRDPLTRYAVAPSTPPPLTPAQEAAWHEIKASLIQHALGKNRQNGLPSVFLLHGVTGSGKTEVYLHAVAQAISLGRRAIVLVPEIALTPQTIDRFAARFANRVAILHSKLSLGEQFDEWQRISEGAFDVVIGSRGAIFAPQPDLGLIVIDEEHEWTYKQQEQPPRYHARDVAIQLAKLTGAVVVLGSATPDVTSYYRAQMGEYRLLELPERITAQKEVPPHPLPRGETHLPSVELIDLRRELREGNRSIFSRSLTQGIKAALAAQEQVILFLNRRGAATFVQCRDCGFVLRCRRCAVSLTYHSSEDKLICHQCNYRTIVPDICPNCWGQRIKFVGIGTQRVENEARRAFPGARLLRWDRDVTRGKHSHEEILARFRAHEADILIGTQMIAKGLDLPLVTLVGVITADINLHLPDFRAGERTFQLLTQVAGRAGRGVLGGRVIAQSYTPEHYSITTAAKHDYATFYQQEIQFRRQHDNPPFSRLARLIYAHTNAAHCQSEAERMYHRLVEKRDSLGLPNITLIGPSPAYTQRVRGRFRWQIVIRGSAPLSLLNGVPIPQGWMVDIDPVNLL